MIKSVFFWTMVFVYVVLFGSAIIIVSVADRSGKRVAALCRSWARMALRTANVKVYVEGAEFADFSGPRIYVSNHQSYFDVLALMAYLPDNARFVAKKSLERIPLFGQAMRAAGTVIIDRKKPEKARQTLSEVGETRMGRGVAVIIFPEGTRNRNGKIGQFKKGGFVLAIETGAAIVPVGISGSQNILPAGGYRVKPGEIRMSIGRPIFTEGLSMDEKDSLIEKTRHQVSALANMLLEEDPAELCAEEAIPDESRSNGFYEKENNRNHEHSAAM